MEIGKVIGALQRFAQDNKGMNVSICLNVTEDGVLCNNNFIFHTIDNAGTVVLISPEDYHKAKKLWENRGYMDKGE